MGVIDCWLLRLPLLLLLLLLLTCHHHTWTSMAELDVALEQSAGVPHMSCMRCSRTAARTLCYAYLAMTYWLTCRHL